MKWKFDKFFEEQFQLGTMDVNCRRADGSTPLLVSLEWDANDFPKELVLWLLRHGADPNAVNEEGYSMI